MARFANRTLAAGFEAWLELIAEVRQRSMMPCAAHPQLNRYGLTSTLLAACGVEYFCAQVHAHVYTHVYTHVYAHVRTCPYTRLHTCPGGGADGSTRVLRTCLYACQSSLVPMRQVRRREKVAQDVLNRLKNKCLYLCFKVWTHVYRVYPIRTVCIRAFRDVDTYL